jgi:radical SAM superfamily enzyme YgiQ (UPF0313 family)
MKILLIDPCKEPTVGKRKRGVTRFPQISLLYIAGLTPAPHTVRILEEEMEPIDFDEPCDLVGITCMTANAPRAYDVAEEFRRRGRRVVLGGVHPTVRPDEAGRHADAVVVGEAEPVWGPLLEDASAGRLKPLYKEDHSWSLDDYPLPRRDGVRSTAVLGIVPVVTSRGCPYACDFCSVHNMFGRVIRHVSVHRVIEDIERSGSRRVMFLDDNIVGDQGYAEKLFDALRGRGISWVGQASISFVHNERLLEKAAASGCKGLFIGLESVSERNMEKLRKTLKTQVDTANAIRRIMQAGILFHASMVFGFDDDEPGIFDETLDFLRRARIASVTFNILTPYPGTVLFDKYKAEGRLLTTDWKDYDHCTPTFTPRHMSAEELIEGYRRVRRSFFSLGNIAARFPANWRTSLLFLVINLGLREQVRAEDARRREGMTQLAASAVGSIGV